MYTVSDNGTQKGEAEMPIKEYYHDEQIEKYRQEVRQRWGDDVLTTSEAGAIGMGKERFAALAQKHRNK